MKKGDVGKTWPKNEEEFIAEIRKQFARMEEKPPPPDQDDTILGYHYNLLPEVIAECAQAAYEYVCHHFGASGAQAQFADLTFLRSVRGYEGPFAIINGENMVYPQYDILAKVRGYLEEWRPWAAEEADRLLTKAAREQEQSARDGEMPYGPSEHVLEHWRWLASKKEKQA